MFAAVNGTDIFYTVVGDGLPCLVPSLGSTPIYERTLATPALLARCQLVFIELRGNRTVTHDAATVTFERLLEDLEGLRRALGLGRVALLGHSAHAVLALAYAARYPAHTDRLILVGGAPALSATLPEQATAYWEVAASPERKRLLAAGLAQLTEERLAGRGPIGRLIAHYAAAGARYFADPAYDCTPLWAGFDPDDRAAAVIFERFWGTAGLLSAFDPRAHFPQIAAPVFIAHGVFDFAAPPLVWSGVKELLPDHTYCAFERSGHYPPLEEREAFDAAIAAWLDRAG